MGLFFNRKKNKKSKNKQDDDAVLNLDVLEPLELTNAIEEKPAVKNAAPLAPTKQSTPQTPKADQPAAKTAQREPKSETKPAPPLVPPLKVEPTGDPTRDAMAQQFAELRRAVAQRKAEEEFSSSKVEQAPAAEPEDVREKSRGIFARKKSAPEPIEPPQELELAEFVETEVQVEPDEIVFEPFEPEARTEFSAPAAHAASRLRMQLDEEWLGLWVAEDGRAIVIEEGDPGTYFVSAMPDPMSKCYTGPDYPEIETWRMPAEFIREPIGEIEGDRLVIETVPGLPEGHSAPEVYLYFLTADEEDEGENRFARRGDRLRSIFMVTDSVAGTVNPWGEGDDVLWLGEPASFYKAPEKLDLYIDKRLRKGDPSNFAE